ncbi:ATP-binding cassette domain-containing protein [Pseudoalteromonas sp. KJ10-2]|uniref:ATP-binding cassette domain-containing protein n=1 Tax=Psychromonas sp. KJ10-2 TaxID=3391822 RepID=UPI0039B556AB
MININNLRFAWQKEPIINIDALSIDQGQHLFIEGPSGSGKSTLLNLLGGVITPQSGEVEILGQSLNQMSSSQKIVLEPIILVLFFSNLILSLI